VKKLMRIYLFGPPRVLYGAQPVKSFPTEKAKLLFFYLALFRKSAHARTVLWGLFWGSSNEAQARHSLSTALWRLQAWLQQFQAEDRSLLVSADQQVRIDPAGGFWLDVAEFEQRIALGRQINGSNPDLAAASLSHALELYQGELLEGYYAEWVLAERDRLHQLFLQTLVHLMIYYGGRREYRQAITCAQRILQDDPLREDVQRELMKLFALDQQPAEALLQYRRCVAVLRDELGIEPMPETQTVFRLLLGSGDETAKPFPAASNMPEDANRRLTLLIDKFDSALKNFEALRDELTQTFGALREQSDIS
jgi:DNA-binding SARP family transcriptional activator